MFTPLLARLKKASRWLPLALLPFAAHAQNLNYGAANAVNVAGTYTDLGTNGTVIATANADDANSAAQNIGFTFNYNGTAFTQFILNTNGLIKLGSTPPSTAALYYENFGGGAGVDPLGGAAGAADINLIMPFNFDLQAGTSAAEYRVQTTGTAPNRVCTIQWKNVSDKSDPAGAANAAASQYANFSFQVKLYENSNIEFVYGTATPSASPAGTRFPNVGLKGSSTATNQVTLALKGVPSDPWSSTTFINQNYGQQAHNISKDGLPDAGRTYRFTPGGIAPPPANDDPAGAIALPLAATCTPTNGTNVGATTTTPAGYGNPGCGVAINPKDVWYKFTTAASGQQGSTAVTITVTGAPAGQVRVFSSTGGAAGPFVSVGCSAGQANNAVAPPLELRGLAPATTYYVFVSGVGSSDTQGAFTICASILNLPPKDAAVTVVYTLGKVSSTFGSPVTAQAVITNAGSAALTNVPVTLTVSGATTYTNTQTVATLAAGASTTVTFTYPVAGASGTNTLTVTVPADDHASNNSQTVTQTISTASLSYISGTTFDGGAGVTSAGSVIAVGYRTAGAAAVTSVTPTFVGTATAGSTYQVLVYSAANGQPGTVLYTSPARPRPSAATGAVVTDAVSVPNVAVNGPFFVGIKTVGAENIGLAYQLEEPLRAGTFFFTTTGTTWTDINTSTLNSRLAVDVTLGVATATRNEALAATVSVYPNPAHQRFTLTVPAGSLRAASATLLNALGQVVQTRQLNLSPANGTANFDVSRLAPGVYSLQLSTGTDLVVKRVVVE
ncbi:hypothetical protein AUC43_02360 [Hymenobacter sedentarius]|uniref:Secretion system C-terminal sorting domain-containing protein n=1 Tax=Hymenobacter sedentarius TaxID=1411621 RepID=A0A0U4BBU0_9BACT|nr:T9SS type A sorting domain-containing protein [Hymenobacter sedentarius]ALW84043.1 hypothetical protein AUC43_02360 [Hymenobacter sedentarius]